jgi:protein-tyrosine phosphatase
MDERPHRVLPLQGATNFRDLGGYVGHAGRAVRWRRLFRSDHLAGLTDGDKEHLAGIGLARSFDFRGVAERAATPYELSGLTQHSLAIEPRVVQRIQGLVSQGESPSARTMALLMQDLYRSFVDDQSHRFAELFGHLLEADEPVVFHCTAGKDRTGFAAALVLLALGVSHDDVMQDYLLTNQVFQPPIEPQSDLPAEALQVLWQVQADFLEAAVQVIERDHGGLDRYLVERMGLGAAAQRRLRERYLIEG